MEKFDRKLRKTQIQEEEQKARKKKGIIILILLLIVLCAIVLLFLLRKEETVYGDYEVLRTTELVGGTAEYLAYDGGYVRYNRDGAQAYYADGTQRWNVAYNLKYPVADVCEGYVAVADKGNTSFYIIDPTGVASSFETTEKIALVRVAAQGVTAVMTTAAEEDHIYLYQPASKDMLVDIKTQTATNGFPISMAISPDGKKLVTSYISMEADKQQSWVTFYNFGEVGQNYVDNMVGSYSFEALVPLVHFASKETVVVVRDNGFEIYQMTEVPKVRYTENFATKIRSVFTGEKYTGFVLEKNAVQGQERLILYKNQTTRKMLDLPLNAEYNRVYTVGEEIVLYGGLNCTVMRANGTIKFQKSFSKNVNYMFSTDDEEKYILIGDWTEELIRLKALEKTP